MQLHELLLWVQALTACCCLRSWACLTMLILVLPYWCQVLEITKQQEITKQHESREREAEFRKQLAQLDKVR